MTVPAVGFSGPTWIQIPGNGAATSLGFPFLITAATDLAVGFIVGGVYTLQTSGFTVQGVGNVGGGQVVFTVAPPTGTTVDLRSQIPETQPTNFANLGAYLPESTTNSVDRVTRLVTDLCRLTYIFGIHGPDTENIPWPALPPPAQRLGMGLVFDTVLGLPTIGALSSVPITPALVNSFLTSVGVGNVLYPVLGVEASAGVVNIQYPYGTVDRYGTNAVPGTTDMRAAIKAAWNVAVAKGGGTIRFINGVQYALSSLDPASPINLATQNSNGSVSTQAYQTQLYCLGGSDVVWDFAGAQLKSTITGGGVGILFDNCQGITLNQPNIVGTQVHTTGVVSVGPPTSGSGYVGGTYTGVLMSGGTGHGCCCTIVVAGGAVISCTPTYPGGGFVVGDVLSTANTNLGGSGSGFSVSVTNTNGAGNVVGTASILPICVTSLSGTSSNITTTDLTSKDCFTGFSVIDGTNGNVTAGITLLGHTSVINAEYGITLQNGGDDTFIANLITFRTSRPYFFYGVQNVVLANLDAQQTNYGFGSIIKAYSRSTRNITVNAVYRNAPGNPTSRISIQVQCDPTVVNPPPTVKNLWITHDENGQPLQTGTAIEFDYFAGSGGTVQTATSSNQLFDQIAIKGITQGYLFSTVQLTTAAAQCQINYDNLEANWSGIVGSGQDIRAGLGFIASREFFCTMSLTFGGTTVAGTNIAPQCFISDGFCKVQGTCTLTAKNGTGQAAFVLPFASRLDATGFSLSPVLGISSMVGLTGTIVGAMGGNSNIMNLYMQAATTLTSVADTNFSASSVLYFDVTYPI